MKQIFSSVLLMLLLWLLPGHALAQPRAVEQAGQSVVQLYAMGYDDQGRLLSRWTGTGFAVGLAGEDSSVFLTNRHVALGSGEFTEDTVKLWLLLEQPQFGDNREPLPGTAIACEILATSPDYPDVAVIRTTEPVTGYPALPLLSSGRVRDGTQVYALGYPGLQSGNDQLVISQGIVSDHLRLAKANFSRALIHTADIVHGFSGGPLVDERGVVVGQNTYGFEADVSTDYFCSVYIDYGLELLHQLGIPCTTADGPGVIPVLVSNILHRPDLSDTAAYAIFAAALVMILLFVLYFLKTLKEAVEEVRENRRKNQP